MLDRWGVNEAAYHGGPISQNKPPSRDAASVAALASAIKPWEKEKSTPGGSASGYKFASLISYDCIDLTDPACRLVEEGFRRPVYEFVGFVSGVFDAHKQPKATGWCS